MPCLPPLHIPHLTSAVAGCTTIASTAAASASAGARIVATALTWPGGRIYPRARVTPLVADRPKLSFACACSAVPIAMATCCYGNRNDQLLTVSEAERTTGLVGDPVMAISEIPYEFSSQFIASGTYGKVVEVFYKPGGADTAGVSDQAPVAVKLFSPTSFVDSDEVPLLVARLGSLTRDVRSKAGLTMLSASSGRAGRRSFAAPAAVHKVLGLAKVSGHLYGATGARFVLCPAGRRGTAACGSAPPLTCALLTNSRWLHLDIKPANICRYRGSVSTEIALVDHDSMFVDSAAALELEQPMPPTLSPIGLKANKMPLVPYHPWWARMTSSPVLMTYAMYFSAALTMSGQSSPVSQETLPAVAREYYRVRALAGQFFSGRFPFPPLGWVLTALGGTAADVAHLAAPATAEEEGLWQYLTADSEAQQPLRDYFLHQIAECWLGPSAPGGEWDVEMTE